MLRFRSYLLLSVLSSYASDIETLRIEAWQWTGCSHASAKYGVVAVVGRRGRIPVCTTAAADPVLTVTAFEYRR